MSKKVIAPLVLAFVGLGLSFLIASSKPAPVPQSVPEALPPQVETIQAQAYRGQVPVLSQGVVEPRRQIDLVAQVTGTVTSVGAGFQQGAFFAAGAELLRIDPRDYEIAQVKAEARLADAQQALATEQGKARQAKLEWRDVGDSDANALFLREPQLASARAQLAAAQAELRQARIDLERTAITAPFAGRILELKTDLGQYINKGTPIATIYASDVAEVALPVTLRQQDMIDLAELESGLPVQLSGSGYAWDGTVRRSGARLDEQTRQLYLFAEIQQPFGAQRPLLMGQFVSAEIPSREFEGLLTLPAMALRPGNEIWVVDASAQLRKLAVEFMASTGDQVTVRLQTPSEVLQVITSYLARATEGMRVTISPEVEAAES